MGRAAAGEQSVVYFSLFFLSSTGLGRPERDVRIAYLVLYSTVYSPCACACVCMYVCVSKVRYVGMCGHAAERETWCVLDFRNLSNMVMCKDRGKSARRAVGRDGRSL